MCQTKKILSRNVLSFFPLKVSHYSVIAVFHVSSSVTHFCTSILLNRFIETDVELSRWDLAMLCHITNPRAKRTHQPPPRTARTHQFYRLLGGGRKNSCNSKITSITKHMLANATYPWFIWNYLTYYTTRQGKPYVRVSHISFSRLRSNIPVTRVIY